MAGMSAMAQEWPSRMPSLEEMNRVNDSITKEASLLYRYERAGWVSSDLFFEQCKEQQRASGSLSSHVGSVVKVIYFDAKSMEVLFDYRHDFTTGEKTIIDSVRAMNAEEVAQYERQVVLMGKVRTAGIEISPYPKEVATYNFDVIRINDTITRVYFLMGALKPKVIPLGNDFSVDFDNNNEIVGKRNYHHTYCPIEWDGDESPQSIWHSHTNDNPYITATDICTFRLYGPRNGVKTLWVLSTAFRCNYLYSVDDGLVVIALDDESLNNPPKKRKGIFHRRKK